VFHLLANQSLIVILLDGQGNSFVFLFDLVETLLLQVCFLFKGFFALLLVLLDFEACLCHFANEVFFLRSFELTNLGVFD